MNKIPKILIVDDNEINRLLVRKVLKKNFSLETARDGQSALDIVSGFSPDLILLDIEMPGLNGWDTCRKLKERKDTHDIPVIMLTGRTDIDAIEQSFVVGALDYIAKPFNARELKLRIKNVLLLIESKEQIQRWQNRMLGELKLAGSLQKSIMSTKPVFTENFDVTWAYRPSSEIGGDVFDIIRCSGGRMCLYVADVSGHGVASAIAASMVKAYLSEILQTNGEFYSPSTICNKLEARFRTYISNSDIYLTIFLMVHDPKSDNWNCISCGHHAPIIFLEDKRLWEKELSDVGGLPIGMNIIPGSEYSKEDELDIPFIPGMRIFVFTDGLIEAPHKKTQEQCEEEGIVKAIEELRKEKVTQNLAEELLDRLDLFGFQIGDDDCSIAVIDVIYPEIVKYDKTLIANKILFNEVSQEVNQVLVDSGWAEMPAATVSLLINEYTSNVLDQGSFDEDSTLKIVVRMYENYCLVLMTYRGREWAFEEAVKSARENQLATVIGQNKGVMLVNDLAEDINLFRYGGQHWAIFKMNNDSVLPHYLPQFQQLQ